MRHIGNEHNQVQSPDDSKEEDAYDEEFAEAVDSLGTDEVEMMTANDVMAEDASDALTPQPDWTTDIESDREKARASKLYKGAVKWSLKRSHELGMPSAGWLVNIQQPSCRCRYYAKFMICTHILIARTFRGIGQISEKKLTSRIKGRTAKARAKALKRKAQGPFNQESFSSKSSR